MSITCLTYCQRQILQARSFPRACPDVTQATFSGLRMTCMLFHPSVVQISWVALLPASFSTDQSLVLLPRHLAMLPARWALRKLVSGDPSRSLYKVSDPASTHDEKRLCGRVSSCILSMENHVLKQNTPCCSQMLRCPSSSLRESSCCGISFFWSNYV